MDQTEPTNSNIAHHGGEPHNDIVYPETIPFLIVHLACLGAIWTGVTLEAVIIAAALYLLRMWAITAGFHRYFSHRSYKTSRAFQFVLAFLGTMCAQRGVIWWAAIHRHHHRHSDTIEDVHSPRHTGFFFSHVGWIFSPTKSEADYSTVPDLTRYPELVWLNKHHYVPALFLALSVLFIAGLPGLVVGFFWSTVAVYHCAFSINSLAHVVGKTRYVTGDDSRNNWWLAVITLGEGWHNNHHRYQSSTRQGFRWYEIDVSYYVLRALAALRLVWDLREPPRDVVYGEQRLTPHVMERVAQDVAGSFSIERIAAQVRSSWPEALTLEEFRNRAEAPGKCARALLLEIEAQLSHLPTLEEMEKRVRERFKETPSLDEIALRARELILEGVATRLLLPS